MASFDKMDSKLVALAQAENNLCYSSSSEVFFYPNACHVCRCFGEKVDLKACETCKVIFYCCQEHAAKDWPNHIGFCKVLCQIMKEWKVDNLFESFKSIILLEELVSSFRTIILKRAIFSLSNIDDLSLKIMPLISARVEIIDRLMSKIVQLLGRPMKIHERQMIANPRICTFCLESNPELLTGCEKCPQSSFCKEHINDPNHENDCLKFLSAFYNQKRILPKNLSSIEDPIWIDTKLSLQTEVKKLPTSMMTFFEQYFSNVSFNTFEIEKRVAFNSYFSEKYSSPLSILLAMEKLNLNLDSMVIHVIGANLRHQIFNDWEMILHYLPQLRKLKLILIGLELLSDPIKIQKECNLCKETKKQLIIEIHITKYQEYCNGKTFEKPDMIACFDAGDFLKESIPILNKGQCPLLVTSFHILDQSLNKIRIESKFLSANCVYNDLNPFASLYYRQLYVTREISAANQFIIIYKHLDTEKVFECHILVGLGLVLVLVSVLLSLAVK